jgi:hypothetical protein
MTRHIFAAAFGALLVALPVRQALRADAALYTVEDLGQIDGVAPTVTGMNAAGQLSGYITDASSLPRAVRYTAESGWEYVPGVSSFYSLATGINASGDLVGYHFDGASFRAFRYVAGIGVSSIEPLPGGTMTFGFGIDAAGNVVGQSDSGNTAEGMRGFRAAPGLPALPLAVGGGSKACGINDAGQIAGDFISASGRTHAFRLETDDSVTDIVPFGGPGGTGLGCAIDAAGRVGGQSNQAGVNRGFLFDSGSLVPVDTFPVSHGSNVESVAAGVAVGWFMTLPGNGVHAFVHTADGSADLNDLIDPGTGWLLQQAFAVNTKGSIAGVGRLNGQARVFRLTPVRDMTAPVITALSASPASIEPPNNGMVTVTVSASATDDRDPAPVCSITGLDGHGAAATDFTVTGALTGWVRARSGATYSFAVACSDAAGNSATGSVDVVVPPDTVAPAITSVSANPSTIVPPDGAEVGVSVTVTATDNVDASPSCSLSAISVIPAATGDYGITGPLTAKVRAIGGRTYTLVVTCRDAAGNPASAAVAVVVPPDTKAPVIQSVTATPGTIWPPNGKMVNVSVAIGATDDLDALPQCAVKSVLVSGGDASDGVVTGAFTASVRAEKNGDGSDRVYTVKVACRDAAGNTSWGSTTVVVTKDGTSSNALLSPKKGLVAKLLRKATGKGAAGNAHRYFSRGSSR